MKAFRNKNMMQGIIIRNPKAIDLQFDTSEEYEYNEKEEVFDAAMDEIEQQNALRKK